MKSSRSWGAAVVVMAWSGMAAAQVPAASASAPAAAAGAPGVAAPAPTPAPATSGAPVTLEDDAAAPKAPEAAPAAPAAEEEEEEAEEAPRKKKRKKAARGRFFNQYDQQEGGAEEHDGRERDGQAEEALPPVAPGFRLEGPFFVLGAERLTSILGWSATASGERETFNGTETVEVTTSGLDVSLLGAGGFPSNPFSAPRVSFDYVFRSGFSLGGSVGYMVSSADTEQPDIDGSGTTKVKQPTTSTILFAPRIGAFIPAAPQVAVWLRGGFTRVVSTVEREALVVDNDSTITLTDTASMWDLALDPQLVLSPAPHVAITLGVTLEIGIQGEVESEASGNTTKTDATQSSYGVTTGLIAMF